jgi:hypothetical protein
MSGGYIRPQKSGEHQLVVFTFAGPVTTAQRDKWNAAILQLKQMFEASLTGITIKGDPTPPRLMRKRKKK